MSATVVEPLDILICRAPSRPSSARAEASRSNGWKLHGTTSMDGKERIRRNGCLEGLTGQGVVLPRDAAAEVDRREAEHAGNAGVRCMERE